eukprot:4551246-Pyramimonas_sp.AAC.1
MSDGVSTWRPRAEVEQSSRRRSQFVPEDSHYRGEITQNAGAAATRVVGGPGRLLPSLTAPGAPAPVRRRQRAQQQRQAAV